MNKTDDLSRWVGRKLVRRDWVNPNRLAAWNATLDRDDPFPEDGEAVPPGFHWTLFPPLARQSELGPDGHERRGDFLPPVPLTHRMWAGSSLAFKQPLRVGESAQRSSLIESVEEKRGRAGPLVFVKIRHSIHRAEGLAIDDEQTLVYRSGSPSEAEPPATEQRAPAEKWRRQIVPDDVLLFRYSALTFNGHRIHYDRRYATELEGYPGLVVHGPLLATLLLDLIRRELPDRSVEKFRFRALRPTFDTSAFTVEGAPGDDERHLRLWTTDNRGQIGVQGEAWIR